MNKNNKSKLIIFILILIVIGITIGFAAFQSSLNIQEERIIVRPDATNFSVLFSSSESELDESEVVATVSDTDKMTATNAVIDNSVYNSPVIKNLIATFTEPGQKVTYTFYSRNTGEYKAYLTRVGFGNNILGGPQTFKTCLPTITPIEEQNATDSLVQEACQDINLTLKIENSNDNYRETFIDTSSNINHYIEKNSSDKITIEITYGNTDGSPHLADGDFVVTFENITLNYSTFNPSRDTDEPSEMM